MGQKLIQANKKQLIPDIDVFLLKYFPHYSSVKTFNSGMFFKTAFVTSEIDGEPLLVRIYFKQDFNDSDKKLYDMQFDRMKSVAEAIDPKKVFNVAPILLVQDHFKAGLIIRQFFVNSLKERMFLMPYLTSIEKKWISFQILFAIKELHSKVNICHGDIKLENILMTSYSSIYLSDPSPFKPAYISIDDMSIYTYYFGTNSNDIKSCYLAPERLIYMKDNYSSYNMGEDNYNTKAEMDVFSAGAVIAELFLEENLFDYTKLLNYKKGNFDLQQSLSKIKDNKLIELLTRMLDVNHITRIQLDDCIKIFATEICPISIPRLFIHINTLITTSSYYKPDMIIGLIYKHWTQIWKILFGLNDPIPILYQKLKYSIAHKLVIKQSFKDTQFDNLANKSYATVQGFISLIDIFDFDHLYQENTLDNSMFSTNDNEDSLFLLLPYIFISIQEMKYDSSIVVALEMLLHFSVKVSDNAKLQLILPNIVKVIKKKKRSLFTRSYALKILFEILHSINYNTLILPTGDYNYFDSYVFPLILSLAEGNAENKNLTLLLEFENAIEDLIYFEDIFLNITLKSKLDALNTMKEKTINHPELLLKAQDEIFKSYDAQLAQFKKKLFNIVENCIYKTEIEILQILIKQFPKLLMFYGKNETENFGRLLIDFFNKTGWEIQREMMKAIPKMMISLGESDLYAYILLCFEGLIGRSVNELQIYELFKSVNYLLSNDYLNSEDSIRIFNSIHPYLLHPNLYISNEIVEFCSNLLPRLTKEEIICYIQEPLSNFLYFPIITLNPERIKCNVRNRLTRCVYLLEIGDYIYERKSISIEDETAVDLFKDIIKYVISTPPIIPDYCFDEIKEFEGIDLGRVIKHKFFLEQKKLIEEEAAFEESFLSKLISVLSNSKVFSLPKIITRDDFDFAIQDGNFLAQELFSFVYLLKNFGITADMDMFNMLVERKWKKEKLTQSYIADVNKANIVIPWRPQGQLLTTIYSNTPIERLILNSDGRFTSIDSDAGATVWSLIDKFKDNSEIICDQVHQYTHQDVKYPITHSKSITSYNKKNIVFASKNKLHQYNIHKSRLIFETIYSTEEGNDIVCALNTSKKYNNNIAFVTRDGRLNIIDERMEGNAIAYDLTIEKGMISAMTLSKNKNSIYIGTLGGHLMSYDFRLNSITDSYKYYDNTPIIGIENTIHIKGQDAMLTTPNPQDNPNCLMIHTGNVDHEIGLWNMDTLHCDYLFKVNTIYGIQKQALNLTIPSITKTIKSRIRDISFDNNYDKTHSIPLLQTNSLETYFDYIKEYTHIYKTNQIRSLLSSNIHSGFYKDASQRLSKLLNIFEGEATVQKILIPKRKGYTMNMQYFLSAGNDMTIRYWDISRESLYSTGTSFSFQKSYLINAPNSLSSCVFSKSVYDNTTIIQSNEYYNNYPKEDMPGLSSYQNINGTTSHSSVQNEFDPNIEALRYCTKIADASHKATITDLLPITIDGNCYLVSASFDGTIKVWR